MSNIVLQVGVKVLLKNSEGKYLLVHRSSQKYPEVAANEGWNIVGGRINPEAGLLENLKREIAEETKLALIGAPRLIAAQDIMRPDKHVVRLTYLGDAEGFVLLDEENDNFGWFTKAEIMEMTGVDGYFRELVDNGLIWK